MFIATAVLSEIDNKKYKCYIETPSEDCRNFVEKELWKGLLVAFPDQFLQKQYADCNGDQP